MNRGYRVIPQAKAGAFRIDMMVEGENDARLAIELDGDEFHGPDRWQADMNRQRVLERAGWVFWCCFASTWSMRREQVLNDLLARMYALGIEPLGAIERVPALVEYREWIGEREGSVGEEPGISYEKVGEQCSSEMRCPHLVRCPMRETGCVG
ncbi:hypothetical protein PI86_03995 [Burkholderia sp. A9]|nr:hypothetical protein PI86_03995 [Burkholderia sp. A9]